MKKKVTPSVLEKAQQTCNEAAMLAMLLTALDFTSEECDLEEASRGLRIFGDILSNRIMDAENGFYAAKTEELEARKRDEAASQG